MNYTYEDIATNYDLWATYVDPIGLDTKEIFDAANIEDKLEIISYCFGEED